MIESGVLLYRMIKEDELIYIEENKALKISETPPQIALTMSHSQTPMQLVKAV